MKSCSDIFFNDERIVRLIYSKQNINPKENKLKANFIRFRYNSETRKNELSCNRFELENIDYCRFLGNHFQDPAQERAYYGIGCTKVSYIKSFDVLTLKYTPSLKNKPLNYSHSDVYHEMENADQQGVANSAQLNVLKDEFIRLWQPYQDNGGLTKENIQPPVLEG